MKAVWFALLAALVLGVHARAQAQAHLCEQVEVHLEANDPLSGAGTPVVEAAWRSRITLLAKCIHESEHARSCLYVQGHYGAETPAAALVQMLGNERVAQLHGAEGRAEVVATELVQLGVPHDRLVRVPPAVRPTYSGVQLTLVRDCRPETSPEEQPEWRPRRLSHEERVFEVGATKAQTEPELPEENAAPLSVAVASGQARGTSLFVSLEALGTYTVEAPKDVGAGGARVGLGVLHRRLYARASGALVVGSAAEQRFGLEPVLSVGFAWMPGLRLGLFAGARIASPEAFKPWLDATWFVGLEVAERLWTFDSGDLWLSQGFAPLGFRKRRAEYDAGELVTRERRDYAPRFELSLGFSADIFHAGR